MTGDFSKSTGWICPKCQKSCAPTLLHCDCSQWTFQPYQTLGMPPTVVLTLPTEEEDRFLRSCGPLAAAETSVKSMIPSRPTPN